LFVQVRVKGGDIHEIETDNIVIAAGASSGKVAALAGIGSSAENSDLAVPLPIEPR